ncbi:hypothetical protein ElyMa_001048400 [Elysia marginata]|uniref:Uncharacterized protein n=1 Tax=Elysia marginata TaxID=1093978 RepID=A0AAV4HNU7_9GAST|nr:hypothetical protein ElyMa_001048400 [Elysia marginata]
MAPNITSLWSVTWAALCDWSTATTRVRGSGAGFFTPVTVVIEPRRPWVPVYKAAALREDFARAIFCRMADLSGGVQDLE